ncbi:hypothetical protein [Streptomyces smyrnaeus]|uniref:hypothetical protein n=1 Tax=Streptomyces smyrnaeus TaxID=1387713 RepID=UPI00369AD713
MLEEEKSRFVKIALDAAGEKYSCVLAGDAALRAHGLADWPVDEFRLFTLPDADPVAARAEIVKALEEAGGEVTVQEAEWSLGLADVIVRHPDPRQGDPITLRLAPVMREYEPERIGGMPVLSLEDCFFMTVENLEWRHTKDYIDLDRLITALGPQFIKDVSEFAYVPEWWYVAEIPDESFKWYGVDSFTAAEIRHRIISAAADSRPSFAPPSPLAVEPWGAASGTLPLTRDEAEAAWDRMKDSPHSWDPNLARTYAHYRSLADSATKLAEDSAFDALAREHRLNALMEAGPPAGEAECVEDFQRQVNSLREDIAESKENSIEWRSKAQGIHDEYLHPMQHEMHRRAHLTKEQRAAEVSLIRQFNSHTEAMRKPSQASIVAAATRPTPHQRRGRAAM